MSLTGLGAVILFSAAIPGQNGKGHVNEQWPSYWAELFSRRDYVPIDCLRRAIWHDRRVDWWYRQNIMLFADRRTAETDPVLEREAERTGSVPMSLIHPEKYLLLLDWIHQTWSSVEDLR